MAKPTYQILLHIKEEERKEVDLLMELGYTQVEIFRSGIKMLMDAHKEK